MIKNQAEYLEFLKRRGFILRTRQDYLSRLHRVERVLGTDISPSVISSKRAANRISRGLSGLIPRRSVVDCAVAMQRYAECFLGESPRYWIEVYWPQHPGSRRGVDGRLYLYFHRQKRAANGKISKGDMVLFYETKEHPDEQWLGAQTIFAYGRVGDSHGEAIVPPGRSGGRTWVWERAVKPLKIVPAAKGVPFDTIRRVLGWKRNAKLRRGPMLINADQFASLVSALKQKKKISLVEGRKGGGQAPRRPRPDVRGNCSA